MSANEIARIVQVSYHRNGVGGIGFHAVLFEIAYESCATCGNEWGWTNGRGEISCSERHPGPPKTTPRLMVASVFPERGCVAVYAVAELSQEEGVEFGENSWRGDRYEGTLRRAIEENDSDGSFKLGPFAIPTKSKRAQAKEAK